MSASTQLRVKAIVNNTQEVTEATGETLRMDEARLSALLEVASFHARRVATTLRLSAADRQDVEQSITLSVLERHRYFDPQRGTWRAFADLMARQAAQTVADGLVAAHRRAGPAIEIADEQQHASVLAALMRMGVDPSDASALRLSLDRFVAELPSELALVATLAAAEEGDYVAAQRRSGLSLREFHRRLREVRYRLMSLGVVRGPRRPRGTIRAVDPY